MHEYSRYVKSEMDKRKWNQNDLAKKAGLTRHVVSAIVTDNRERLINIPSDKTMDGPAKAFVVDPTVIRASVALAMGLPVEVKRASTSDISDSELIMELSRRLEKARNDSPPSSTQEQGTPGKTNQNQKTPQPPLDRLGYNLAAMTGHRALDADDEAASRRGEEHQE